ncbi:hybrid sensor histidine kinase/response regulator [Pseudoprimorskyibacter insulae]|uniref:histidine kinase n=1 Tax=Pseudoprimorskyibacter insulae TaxID=1695997 RepID=A0A2R8AUT3_9RHOB|nr:PAS-domain containing protein [Pseudoprimorskyibacter insulae]SPF79781.1 Sensor kinase CckA [Pseudoprimorskyibacter insulae]
MVSKDVLTAAGLNLIQQALTIYDSDLQLVVCNRRFVEMFDLPDRFIEPGAGFAETIRHLAERGEYGPIDDLDTFTEDRVRTALAFEPHYMERTRANGRVISVEGTPLPQGGWVTVYTDITRTKEQERLLRTRSELLSEEVLARSEELAATNRNLAATISALEEARRQLTAMEAHTRQTTEMMPAHIAHVDASRHYTFSNRRLNAILPGRPSGIIGMHISEALGPTAYERVRPHLELALAGQQSTFEFSDEDSSRRVRVVFTPDQSNNGAYILSTDVTEETQARAALQQTRRREIAAQLTSGLAHDFSNLLTIILGMQSRLQRIELAPEAQTLVSATLTAARRGGTLLNRIADITSHRAFRPQPVRMAEFLADLAPLARASLPEGITLDVQDDTHSAVLLDAGMLQDSLLNLILNARDACDGDGNISLICREVQDTWVEFCVADTGPGFTEQALIHGLDPFFTTKGDGGSGLGLAMVYDMTKLAGGEARLRNTPSGAEVRLRLPLRRAEAQPVSGLVLLVEDSADLRVSIRDMLVELGYMVVEAASVAEALELVQELPEVALILSDITLEGEQTGVDLARALHDRPVRLMTSLPADHPLHEAARHAAPLLTKPFTTAQLAGFLGHERPDA